MADANHYLVSFESVSASVGGFDISSIVEMHLSAAANDIPQITLLVDAGNSGGSEPQVASAMTLANAREVLDTCRSMIKQDGSTLSLSMTVKAVGSTGTDTQELSISGWLLTDASLSPIQESGVCTVALTFMHPLCKAHFGGVVPGLMAAPPDYSALSGDNPMAVFLSALSMYGSAMQRYTPREFASVPGASSTAAVRSNLITRMAKAGSALSSALTWTSGGLPAYSQLAVWGNIIRVGISDYALPSGGTSVFQRFAKCLVPECSLAIGGDYTGQQLEVGPFKPWADASMTIKDSDIISLTFPQSDPSPISGIHLVSNNTSDSLECSYHNDASQADEKPSDIFYVPQDELSKDYLYGPIYQMFEPGWLTAVRSYLKNKSSHAAADVTAVSTGYGVEAHMTGRNETMDFASPGGEMPANEYAAAMVACAKAYYETSLMKDWSFTVNTRLMFKSGSTICPGKVISVKADNDEVLAGYVAGVTHTISVANRSAHTSIVCTHPRFGEAPNGITGGNALYA